MKTSFFDGLRQPTKIVLSAGHGDGDPGVVNGKYREADQTIVLVDQIAKTVSDRGVSVDIVPHSSGLNDAIKYVNKNYNPRDVWAVEIHRDSADGLSFEDASFRCGAYHYPYKGSTEIALFLARAMTRFGANEKTWARPDTRSKHKSLAWIRNTQPVAHLLELGFIQGSNAQTHLRDLSEIASKALYEAFTGLSWDDDESELPSETDSSAEQLAAVPIVSPTPSSNLLGELVAAYRIKDMGAMFNRIKANVPFEAYDDLQNATVAQWILESGWAKSQLAREHFNFGGLKWRPEMKGWTKKFDGVVVEPVKYTAWDGPDTYCKFESPSEFIDGYWRFIMRSPYDGWEDYSSDPKEYIDFLLRCGYTVSDTYLDEVMSLLPKAAALLAGASSHPGSMPVGAPQLPPPISSVIVPIPPTGSGFSPSGVNSVGNVDSEHWLSTAKKEKISGGNNLKPRYVVIHYTEGFSAKSSISGWKKKKNGILAHVVVDRDGTIYQCRPFNRTCGHAGGVGMARWQDPRNGEFYDGANASSIGIEIANTGMNTSLHKKLGKGHPYPDGTTIKARHRNGKYGSSEARDGKVWEEYPKTQLESVFSLVSVLMEQYDLHDITGHDCVSTERKADPGPAFPMIKLREENGLDGLPVVWNKKFKKVPI